MKLSFQSVIRLNNGVEIPRLGFGVWQAKNGEEAENAIGYALEAGYRHIDTAAVYGNEESVGRAMKKSGLKRNEIFLTTKLWNADQREHRQMKAFEESLARLDTDHVDLYLVHWPVGGCITETWKVMEEIYRSGRARAIGVSNFKISHLEELLSEAEICPAVDQMEFNPCMQDNELLTFCRNRGIAFEAWSPLGSGIFIQDNTAAQIGKKYGKSGPQVILRWILQKDIIAFPKSVHKNRIEENRDLFDFELTEEECALLDAMNCGKRTGPDPDCVDF